MNHAEKKYVWMSDTGSVTCTEHAFPFLRRRIDMDPTGPIVFTPHCSWMRVYEEDARNIGHVCLTCHVLEMQALSDEARTTSMWTLMNSSDSATRQPTRTAPTTQL